MPFLFFKDVVIAKKIIINEIEIQYDLAYKRAHSVAAEWLFSCSYHFYICIVSKVVK